MKKQLTFLDPNRLFPVESKARNIARNLYESVKDLPIISPHGHTDPGWIASNANFTDASRLLIIPDHYIFRMLYSQGFSLEQLGISRLDGTAVDSDFRKIWKVLANNYHLFLGTPSRLWMDHVFAEIFGFKENLCCDNSDYFYDSINEQLASDAYRPRALMERFNIELIATTEGATDELIHHKAIAETEWKKRVITTFRPDDVADPDRPDFLENIKKLGQLANEDISTWEGYLNAIKIRRKEFRKYGATATDHGHPTAQTSDLNQRECEQLYGRCIAGNVSSDDAELFRAQILTEMAGMSIEDGMVMQIHSGARRNYNQMVYTNFGYDKGADIPSQTNYLDGLKPLLDKYGNSSKLNIILFTLDETTYSRELAPIAGHFPSIKLGPPWWFHDSPEGMLRYRQQVMETAGIFNTVGFNDDTRAFLSIPARHDVARRMDCRYLANLVTEGRLGVIDAEMLAKELAYNLVKQGYKL